MTTDLEATFLTALLFDQDSTCIDRASLIARPEDLASEDMRKLYRALLEMRKDGTIIDLLHAAERLVEQEGWTLDRAAEVVDRASDGAPILGNIEVYARRVHESAKSRRLAVTLETAAKRIGTGMSPEEAATEAVNEIQFIEDQQPAKEYATPMNLALPIVSALNDQRLGCRDNLGLPTGIVRLDEMTTGIRPAELWIVGAMPGRGKSALAVQVCMNLTGQGFPVYFMSLEMSSTQIFRRLLATKFSASSIREPDTMSTDAFNALTEYAAELRTLPLYIDDQPSLSVDEIAAKARTAIRRHGIRLVIVDYLQLVKGEGDSRRERIGDAANTFRILAKETGVPVLALSQLRRPDNLNDQPSMIELKESGDLESHAHVVLLLHTPMEDGHPTGLDELIVGKQREGPVGALPVVFDRRFLLFRERLNEARHE